jgi:threonine synthase
MQRLDQRASSRPVEAIECCGLLGRPRRNEAIDALMPIVSERCIRRCLSVEAEEALDRPLDRRAVIDETVTVTEPEIAFAMRKIAEMERWMVEGAACVAVAGLIKRAEAYRRRKVAAVLCGRNIALETFLRAVDGSRH